MKTILNPFSRVDEQAMIEQFYDLHGRDIAEKIDRIAKNCCWKNWEKRCAEEGISQSAISDFRQISK